MNAREATASVDVLHKLAHRHIETVRYLLDIVQTDIATSGFAIPDIRVTQPAHARKLPLRPSALVAKLFHSQTELHTYVGISGHTLISSLLTMQTGHFKCAIALAKWYCGLVVDRLCRFAAIAKRYRSRELRLITLSRSPIEHAHRPASRSHHERKRDAS